MLKLAFTGDCIATFEPKKDYFNNNKVIELLEKCDFVSGNLEMVISGNKAFASTYCGGEWLTVDEVDFEIIKKYGFTYLNTANNHTMDYSYTGMEITNNILDKNQILHSGSGKDLQAAEKAVYKKMGEETIALISCTASGDDASRAGYSTGNMPGRPGVNMLRHSEVIYATPEQLRVIDEIAEQTAMNARFLKSVKMGIHTLDPKIHRLGRTQFVWRRGAERAEKKTYCNKNDIERILASVKEARKKRADCIIMNAHSHDIKGATDDTPDDYFVEFAHRCIDEGVTVFIGTGTHQLKGIEVYKNRPIFYSLGNFIFADEYLKYWSADFTEKFGVTSDINSEELWNFRSSNKTTGLEFDEMNYNSIIPIVELSKGKINRLCLYPIELGFDGKNGKSKGYPYLAEENKKIEIVDRIMELSKEYKTKFKDCGDITEVILNE